MKGAHPERGKVAPGRICLLALLLIAVGLGSSCAGRPEMSIAVKFDNNDLGMVDSNLGPVLVDTGSPTALVSEAVARKHGLRRLGQTVFVTDVVGGRAQAEMAIIDHLQIPAKEPGRIWELRNIPTVVVRDVGAVFKHFGASIVIGMPVFKDQVIEFDYPKSEIRLLRSLPFGLNCTRVPLSTADYGGDGVPGVPGQVEGMAPTQAVLDSGYAGFFTFGAEIWEKLPVQKGSRHMIRGGGFLKSIPYEKAMADARITVGNLDVHGAFVERSDGRTWEHNLVGSSVLRHTTMAIDWNKKKAVFSTPSPFYRGRWVRIEKTPPPGADRDRQVKRRSNSQPRG